MSDPKASGALKFEGGLMDGEIRGWRGTWPPPERIVAVVGPLTTHEPVLSALDMIPAELWEQLRQIGADISYYVKINVADGGLVKTALYGYDGREKLWLDPPKVWPEGADINEP